MSIGFLKYLLMYCFFNTKALLGNRGNLSTYVGIQVICLLLCWGNIIRDKYQENRCKQEHQGANIQVIQVLSALSTCTFQGDYKCTVYGGFEYMCVYLGNKILEKTLRELEKVLKQFGDPVGLIWIGIRDILEMNIHVHIGTIMCWKYTKLQFRT